MERLQSKLQFDSHPIFGITAPPASTLGTTSVLPGPLLPARTAPTSTQATPTNLGMEGVSPTIAALQEALLSLPNLLPVTTDKRGQGMAKREEEGSEERLRFLVRTDVPPEGIEVM